MAKQEYELKIWLPGSIVLFGIGLFTLLTPCFTRLDREGLILDLISGVLLIGIGGTGFIIGLTRQKKKEQK